MKCDGEKEGKPTQRKGQDNLGWWTGELLGHLPRDIFPHVISPTTMVQCKVAMLETRTPSSKEAIFQWSMTVPRRRAYRHSLFLYRQLLPKTCQKIPTLHVDPRFLREFHLDLIHKICIPVEHVRTRRNWHSLHLHNFITLCPIFLMPYYSYPKKIPKKGCMTCQNFHTWLWFRMFFLSSLVEEDSMLTDIFQTGWSHKLRQKLFETKNFIFQLPWGRTISLS